MPFKPKEYLTFKNIFFLSILLFVLYISFYKNRENATSLSDSPGISAITNSTVGSLSTPSTNVSGTEIIQGSADSPSISAMTPDEFNKMKTEYIESIKDKNIKNAVKSIQDKIYEKFNLNTKVLFKIDIKINKEYDDNKKDYVLTHNGNDKNIPPMIFQFIINNPVNNPELKLQMINKKMFITDGKNKLNINLHYRKILMHSLKELNTSITYAT